MLKWNRIAIGLGDSVARKTKKERVLCVEKEAHQPPNQTGSCSCFNAPLFHLMPYKDLDMDESYAEVTLLICAECGQFWLRYHFELEAFTASGRWYLGAITPKQALLLTVENAKATLEGLSWYFYGGSYYDGRSGKSSGQLW